MFKEIGGMGANFELSGPRSVIGDLVHLDPVSGGGNDGLTMRFRISSPEGIVPKTTSGVLDLGGVKAQFKVN